ncbi:MATE family efflux transporter [Anaerovorax odorimutans]|uniref:Probable multidrug resistance protein NorM n=1 Tax=Anaerovorax odorimutans TaxID=109327 RepID=A0ABT1RKK2_9FIRM|nr:MATE family efflux transporter [Anaerovorax odorimutans]MCQ4635728.1 MATE family efflux transporter [Anaerovorax odorimutans]
MFERKGTIINQQFMKFFLPTVLMTMALSMSIVVDGIIVGNLLGADALAAVNLVLPVTLLFNAVYVLFGVGGCTLYSVALGRRQKERARQLFTMATLAMAVVALAVCALGWFLCGGIAEALTTKAPDLTPLVYDYIKYVMLAAPFLILVPGLVYFVRATGRVKLASSVLIVANVVNLALDIVYIVCLDAGISGAALATGTGYLVGFCMVLYGIITSKQLRFYKLPESTGKMIKEITVVGLPDAINTSLNFFRLTCINLIVMTYLGSDGVTAFSVCTSCLSIVSMFVGGSAQTISPLLGTLYGEEDYAGIRFTIKKALTITGISTIVLLVIFEAVPGFITGLFGVTDPVQVAIASEAIRIYAISLPFMGFLFISMCVYKIMARPKISNVIALLEGFFIVVPAAWLLGKLIGATGVWLAFPIGELLTIAVLLVIIKRIAAKEPELKGFFLIPDPQQGRILDVTMIRTIGQATALSQKAIDFCRENSVPEVTANKVGVVLEEMAVNQINQRTGKKKDCIDVRIMIDNEEICISFRDNGVPANPLEKPVSEDVFEEIAVARAIAKNIDYDNILGMNCLIARISRKGDQ